MKEVNTKLPRRNFLGIVWALLAASASPHTVSAALRRRAASFRKLLPIKRDETNRPGKWAG